MVRKPDTVHKLADKPTISGLPNDESLDLIAQLVDASDDTDPDLVDHCWGLATRDGPARLLPYQCVGMSLPAAAR